MSEETVEIYGHCASFCAGAIAGEHPARGTEVEEHGRYCYGGIRGVAAIEPAETTVYLHPVSVYRHGTYPRSVIAGGAWKNDLGIELAVERHGQDPCEVRLTPAHALELAAYLTNLAHVVMGIDGPHPRLVP